MNSQLVGRTVVWRCLLPFLLLAMACSSQQAATGNDGGVVVTDTGSPTDTAKVVPSEDANCGAVRIIIDQIGPPPPDAAFSCTFSLPVVPPDTTNVKVLIGAETIPFDPSNGWQYTSGNHGIVFVGSACEQLRDAPSGSLLVLYGCSTTPLT
jgi:hypothetical protein